MMNDIIVGIGEVLWDVFPEGKRIGGAPANFAYHMSQFGFDSRVVSAVGEDVLGDEILEILTGRGYAIGWSGCLSRRVSLKLRWMERGFLVTK